MGCTLKHAKQAPLFLQKLGKLCMSGDIIRAMAREPQSALLPHFPFDDRDELAAPFARPIGEIFRPDR